MTEISFNSFDNAPIQAAPFIPSVAPTGPSGDYETAIANPAPEQQPQTNVSEYYFNSFHSEIVSVEGSDCNDLYIDVVIAITPKTTDYSCPVKTTAVTKRIKLCKASLIQQAQSKEAMLISTATFVENIAEPVKEEPKPNQRLLELAGISHSKNYVSRGIK